MSDIQPVSESDVSVVDKKVQPLKGRKVPTLAALAAFAAACMPGSTEAISPENIAEALGEIQSVSASLRIEIGTNSPYHPQVTRDCSGDIVEVTPTSITASTNDHCVNLRPGGDIISDILHDEVDMLVTNLVDISIFQKGKTAKFKLSDTRYSVRYNQGADLALIKIDTSGRVDSLGNPIPNFRSVKVNSNWEPRVGDSLGVYAYDSYGQPFRSEPLFNRLSSVPGSFRIKDGISDVAFAYGIENIAGLNTTLPHGASGAGLKRILPEGGIEMVAIYNTAIPSSSVSLFNSLQAYYGLKGEVDQAFAGLQP